MMMLVQVPPRLVLVVSVKLGNNINVMTKSKKMYRGYGVVALKDSNIN
jgi:hypothetical protein